MQATNTISQSLQASKQAEGKIMRFMIAGGGTGGHIFPAIAIANALKNLMPTAEFLFVGAKHKMEMEKVPQAGYNIKGLDIAGFNRSSIFKNLTLPFKIIKSFFQVANIFKSFLPDAVIGVGGYSSYPVLKYAQNKKVPTFIHESNSFAGKSNIILGRHATKIFTASENMKVFFNEDKIILTGNPVRRNISHSTVTRDEGLQFFGLENKKTVLVVGGSLGAKSINEVIGKSLEVFKTNDFQLIWQTGKSYFQQNDNVIGAQKGIVITEFITKMEYAYAAADVIISRSGAMAVAELCLVKKPVIFIPYPFAAEDHQTANAKVLVDRNAALMIKDSNANNELIPALLNLLKDKNRQDELGNNISTLGVNNADEIIAAQIIETLKTA